VLFGWPSCKNNFRIAKWPSVYCRHNKVIYINVHALVFADNFSLVDSRGVVGVSSSDLC